MTPQNALQILSQAVAMVKADLKEHQMMQQAIQVIDKLVNPKPEPEAPKKK